MDWSGRGRACIHWGQEAQVFETSGTVLRYALLKQAEAEPAAVNHTETEIVEPMATSNGAAAAKGGSGSPRAAEGAT